MGETDCSKSSNIATLKFELSEKPILDLKAGTGNHCSKLKDNRPRTRIRRVAHSSTTLIRRLVCRIVARKQYANIGCINLTFGVAPSNKFHILRCSIGIGMSQPGY